MSEKFLHLFNKNILGLINVRDEMVKLAHSQSNKSGNQVVTAEIVLQEGHAIEIEKEYHYGSSKSMPFA